MNNESFINEKSQVANIAKEMAKLDLVSGSSGNVSMRMPNNKSGYMAITPMGLHYSELQDQNIVVVDEELDCIEDSGVPSSESLLHLGIYQTRSDINAVVHTCLLYTSDAADE